MDEPGQVPANGRRCGVRRQPRFDGQMETEVNELKALLRTLGVMA